MEPKTKAEIVEIVKQAQSGGPEKIVEALMSEGCIDSEYVIEEGEEMGEEGEAEMEIEAEPPEVMGMGEESEYAIPKGMPLPEARGVAVKFAMKGMDKEKK